jgi:uncharacterized membrane protein YbhN (UPF0104 family)
MGIHGKVVLAQLLVWTGGVIGTVILLVAGKTHIHVPWRPVTVAIEVVQELGRLFRSAAFVLPQLVLAVLYSLTFSATLWSLAKALTVSVSPALVLVFSPIILFVASLPFFFQGWGGREAIILATLSAVGGVVEPQALGLSIAYGAVVFVCALPGGLLWLMRPGLRKTVRQETSEEDPVKP